MEASAAAENQNQIQSNPCGAVQPSAEQEIVRDEQLASAQLPKIETQLSLYEVLQVEEARKLDQVLASKKDSPIILGLEPADNTLRFMRACLRGSYLFGREVVPNYLANVFQSLSNHAPADDQTGRMLKGLTEMCIGELSTNNIYGRPGESHSHFHDLREAFTEAGGNVEEFQKFMDAAEAHGTLAAIKECSTLWSAGSQKYAEKLMACCRDPLASFILMPCNEILSTVIYPVAIEHMSEDARFDKFRRFLDVHVQLDGDNHGCVALEWLAHHVKKENVSQEAIVAATKKVMALYQGE